MTEQTFNEESLSPKDQERLERGRELERLIFASGVLDIDPEKYLENSLRHYSDDPRLDEMKAYYEEDLPWITEFNGKVPSTWIDQWNIKRTFAIALRMGAQVNTDLITAALAHRSPHSTKELAMGQKLTVEQLAKAFTRLAGPIGHQPGIIERQLSFGMSRDDIQTARDIAYKEVFGKK